MASQCKERSICLENKLLSGQSSTAMAKPPPARLLSTEKEKPKLLAGSSLLRTAPLLSQTSLLSRESNSKPFLPSSTLKSRLPSSTSLTGPPLGKPLLTQSSLQLSGNISSSSRPLTSGAPTLSIRPPKSSGPRLISSVQSHEQKRATNLLLKQKLGFSSLESSSIRRKLVEPKKRNAQASETEPVARPIELESTDGFCLPEYDLGSVDESPLDIVKSALASMNFPTEEERRGKQRSVALAANKTLLLNCVATSLLQLPDFRNPSDPTLSVILETCRQIALLDPEFILKVALYARCELNIRSVANFLLAVAANCHTCRPYIKKYFSASIRLPSDWIDVAEMYQAFHDKSLISGSLPVALRKAMVAKFPQFDSYQLAKYNKTKKKKGPATKKKKKKAKEEEEESSDSDVETSDDDDDKEDEEELARLTFTLKQLIRKLHITAPVDHVMSLIGKKYPADLDSFYLSKLPGTWNSELAGKRMKLAMPETWETQVSLKGNHASTWQDLIDHRKLPFMAMLRNLRNVILAGISSKHHSIILKKLADERAVVNSRQFPFRFFSAFEVLGQLEKMAIEGVAVPTSKAKSRGKTNEKTVMAEMAAKRRAKKLEEKAERIDLSIIERYRRALDTSVKIATHHNVKPVSGRTLLLCNVGSNMERPCTSARGLGKPRTVLEVSLLLGLMCKFSCEECEFRAFGADGQHMSVILKDGSILQNMGSVLEAIKSKNLNSDAGELPRRVLTDYLLSQTSIDTLMILDGSTSAGRSADFVANFLEKYRRTVNSNLLYVNVDLSGTKCSISTTSSRHENDVFIAGYSDQILRFIAERGGGGQLAHVENIDKAHHLTDVKQPSLGRRLPVVKPPFEGDENTHQSLKPRWRTARVFISSTFKDMHGERDLLTRYVFPELRERAKRHFINVYEVDLRWGVTENEMNSRKGVEICLSEVDHCDFFVGILGERYGWIPDRYDVPDEPEFDWVRDYASGRSITELEIHHAALANPLDCQTRAFFYFRDQSFLSAVPEDARKSFEAESSESAARMADLKARIQTSGLEVFENYSCEWGGVLDGKPMVRSLEEFGSRVLNNLWNALLKEFPDEEIGEDEMDEESRRHRAFAEHANEIFTGRKNVLKQAEAAIEKMNSGVIVIAGKPGMGKTSLMSAIMHSYGSSASCSSFSLLLAHFVGVSPGSTNISKALRRICYELKTRFDVDDPVAEEYNELAMALPEMLAKAALNVGVSNKIIVFVDGLDQLDEMHSAKTMEWLPDPLPNRVLFVVSVLDSDPCYASLQRRHEENNVISLSGLDMFDKADMVRDSLGRHRKTLNESAFNNQLKILLSKKDATIPLYLALACEELRVFGVYEKVSEKLKQMPSSLGGLLQDVLNRLEVDHGRDLVSMALHLLICSRNGLSEVELLSLLSLRSCNVDSKLSPLDPHFSSVLGDLSRKSPVSQANFIRLIRSLQCFLQSTAGSRDGVMLLCHSDVINAIKKRYLKSSPKDEETKLHRLISAYFYNEADPARDGTFSGLNKRACSELAYHLTCAGAWEDLGKVVCNLRYIQVKCQLGLGLQVVEDLQAGGKHDFPPLMEKERQKFLQSSTLQEYRSFVSQQIHIMSSYSTLVMQQAINEPATSIVSKAAREIVSQRQRGEDSSLLLWVNKPDKSHPCQMTISGNSKLVLCVAISSDGRLIACGSQDCTVKLYELATGKEVKSFVGHAHAVVSCCFAGASRLCSASLDGAFSLWDVQGGHRISTAMGHKRQIGACASDPSGSVIVSVGWDARIVIWSGKDGSVVAELKSGEKPINCVDFHPEGQFIVTGSWDSRMRIYDTFNRKRIKTLRGHSCSVRAVAYSPSGVHIASASLDGQIKIWHSMAGIQVGCVTGHALPVNAICFTKSGHLVTGSDDQLIKVWSGYLGKPTYTAHAVEDVGGVLCLAVDPSSRLLAAGYHEKLIRIYDALSGVELDEIDGAHTAAVCCLAWEKSGFGERFVSGSDDGTLKIISSSSKKTERTLVGHEKGVWCVDWRNKLISSGSEDFTVCLYDVKKKPTKKQPSSGTLLSPVRSLAGHSAPVTGVCLTSDEKRVISASRDKTIIIWDTQTGSQIKSLSDAHKDWINSLALSEKDDFIVTASNDFTVKLWNLETFQSNVQMKGHLGSVTNVAITAGCIVSSSVDGSVKLWSRKGIEITTLHGHERRVNACCVFAKDSGATKKEESTSTPWADMADDRTETDFDEEAEKARFGDVAVISGGDDGSIRSWMALQANELAALSGHSGRVLSVKAVGDRIVTSALDKTVKVWLPQVGPVVRGHSGSVTCGDMCPSGYWALTSSRDGSVLLWSLQGDHSSFSPRLHSKVMESSEPVNAVKFLESSVERATFVVGKGSAIQLWIYSKRHNLKLSLSHGDTGLPVTCLAYSRKSCTLLSGSWDKSVIVWKFTGDALQKVTVLKGPTDWITNVSFSEDESYFMATLADSKVFVWNSSKTFSRSALNLKEEGKQWTLLAHGTKTSPKMLSDLEANKEIILVGSSSGSVSVFDRVTGKQMVAEKLHSKAISGGGVGKYSYYTGSTDATVKVWSSLALQQIGLFCAPGPVTSMAVSVVDEADRILVGDSLGNVLFLHNPF